MVSMCDCTHVHKWVKYCMRPEISNMAHWPISNSVNMFPEPESLYLPRTDLDSAHGTMKPAILSRSRITFPFSVWNLQKMVGYLADLKVFTSSSNSRLFFRSGSAAAYKTTENVQAHAISLVHLWVLKIFSTEIATFKKNKTIKISTFLLSWKQQR